MKTLRPVLFLLCLCIVFLHGQVRTLSFYEVRPCGKEPVVDGKLNDAAWQNLPQHRDYYVYAKPDGGPGALKTMFMMTYCEKGLYMAVVNYEENMDKIRKNVTNMDDPNLWMDDCGEFYFDPDASSIGFTKFTINCTGVTADMRRQDAAIVLADWNGSAWRVKTSLNEKDWTIEAFFPWDDLNSRAKAGDLWMFCHTRYNWVNGFVGVGSSQGGGYQAPDKFGYLYFSGVSSSDGKNKMDSQAIGELLRQKARAPWILGIGQDLVTNMTGRVQIDSIDNQIQQAASACSLALTEVMMLDPKEKELKNIGDMSAKYQEAKSLKGLTAFQAYKNLSNSLFDLKWRMLADRNFNK